MFFYVFDSFFSYHDVVACNVFGDDAVKFPVELANEVQCLSPAKNIFVAARLVKKKFSGGQMDLFDNVNDDTNPLASGWRHEAVGKEMASLFGVD